MHYSASQTRDFIDVTEVNNVVLVHGDHNNVRKLKDRLTEEFKHKKLQVYTPKNTDTVRIKFVHENIVKVCRRTAPRAGSCVLGARTVQSTFAGTDLEEHGFFVQARLLHPAAAVVCPAKRRQTPVGREVTAHAPAPMVPGLHPKLRSIHSTGAASKAVASGMHWKWGSPPNPPLQGAQPLSP